MIEWGDWGTEAFARAERQARPVLLSLTAAWCRACHEMDRTTYADPAVAELVRSRFVPIRVDADRRPDINERYNLGGWPTTAFLTPDGRLITGATFVPADRMIGVLSRVAAAFESRASELVSGPASEGRGLAEADSEGSGGGGDGGLQSDSAALASAIFSTFDEQHGGFGVEPKFPHTAPLHLALALFRETGEGRWRTMVERTLDAMMDGRLWDHERGGFHRYAATRDWQLPHAEKLLETNAALLRVYAEAAIALGRSVDRDRTGAIASYITGALRAEGGGYYGSEADRVLYADANACAAVALLHAASALGDQGLLQEALVSFERVLLGCYRPGRGVAHYVDGEEVRGLLSDQVNSISALLDAHDASDAEPYHMMAEEIGHFLVRDLWDGRRGGFCDRAPRPDDIGLLHALRKPCAANAEAAIALARLQRVSREFDFTQYALGALKASAAAAAGAGPQAAQYVLASRQLR